MPTQRDWQRYARKGSTKQRGYSGQHPRLRAQWKPQVDAGQVMCHAIICLEERDGRGRRIQAGAPWHLGHTADRTGWTGPEHQRCGAADGARRGNRRRGQRRAMAKGQATPIPASPSPLRTSRSW